MIKRLVIFGATGDLTARYVLPGIAALRDAGLLPEGFTLTCSGRDERFDASLLLMTAAEWRKRSICVIHPRLLRNFG